MIAKLINFTFTPATKKLVLKEIAVVDVARIQYIYNVTRNVVLYTYSSPTTITSDGTNIITISANTAGMAYNDELTITYDFPVEDTGGTVTAVLGTANRIVVSSPTPNPIIDIASTYVGQTSLTTLGTITTGTWNASVIPILYGGTGQTTANTALNAFLPPQGANTGKFLTTDGTNTSWGTVTPQVYPGVGVPLSTGSAWSTSYSTSGTGNVALTTSPIFTTPRLNSSSTLGHIWTATDTSGNGSFQAPATSGTVTGTGTQNYVTKWNNAGGTAIGNSQIFDNGTNVLIGSTTDRNDAIVQLTAPGGSGLVLSLKSTLGYTRTNYINNASTGILDYDSQGFHWYDAIGTSKNAAVSYPIIFGTGSWYSGGSSTTTKPYLLIEPTGTTSTGWSTSGTGLGINAATGFTGRIIDGQVNGTSVFNVASTGNTTFGSGTAYTTISNSTNTTAFVNNGGVWGTFSGNNWTMGQWGSNFSLNTGGTNSGISNRSGNNFLIKLVGSSGSGTAGDFIVQTTPAGASGTQANPLVEAFRVKQNVSGTIITSFGGTTASYPALVSNGTGIDIKLADNSAYTSMQLLGLTWGTGSTLGTAGQLSSVSTGNFGNGRITLGAGLTAGANGALYSNSGKSLELVSDAVAGRGMIIETGTGNVGIGTTSPATKLDVNGSSTFRGAQYVNVNVITDADYTVSSTDYIISCKNWTTDHRITLPDPTTSTNRELIFTNTGSVGRYSFSRDITQISNSVITATTNLTAAFKIVSDGAVWQIVLTGLDI